MSDLAKRLFNKSNYVLDLPLVRKCDAHESTSISSLLRQAANKINRLEARNKELEGLLKDIREDLILRGDGDSTGAIAVNLSNSIYDRLKKAINNE